jgi:ribonucleoside-diphosphate reductase alpha chain
MEAIEKNEDYELINPRTKEVVGKLNARKVFSLIATFAWKNGDPGMIFIDEINRHNPTSGVGEIEATNPCGEQPLLPYESCNLGSINLSKIVKKIGEKYEVDWKKLKEMVETAVHFLDNVIDINSFPIKEIEKATKGNRKIGLGIMGFADLLILLEIPYDSEEAEKLAEELMKFITETGRNKSRELGKKRGNFPNFKKSIWKDEEAMRNATITTIAPTGTIGIIANCSSGIEPIFAISYIRNVANSLGENLIETNQLFERVLREKGLYNEEIIKKVAGKASIQDIEEIPKEIRRIFVSAHDISPEWHLRLQAAFQKHTDNAVSKTINLPSSATIQDIEKIYIKAWKMKCKGITIYRDKSREEQVISFYSEDKKEEKPENKDTCPNCGDKLVREEGCKNCKSCGYSVCE